MSEFWTVLIQHLMLIRFWDIVDIVVVTLGIYAGIRLVKETRAAPIIKGIIAVVVVAQIADWFDLNAIRFILSNTLQVGLLAIIIMFQPELRRALEKIGNSAAPGQLFTTTSDLEELSEKLEELRKNS